MITEERHRLILKELKRKGSLNVLELVNITKASESTIRRDLLELDHQGLLKRVHGGAVLIERASLAVENPLSERQSQNSLQKELIGKYVGKLVEENDTVYIDAGSTTIKLIDYLIEKKATYVTNGLLQAQMLAQKGFKVICLGGEIRGITGACVGASTYQKLSRYHFTKAFFGTNGVDIEHGFTTPDNEEALIKEAAFSRCEMNYILCDHSKFNKLSPVHFGDINEAIIICDYCKENQIKEHTTVVEVDKV